MFGDLNPVSGNTWFPPHTAARPQGQLSFWNIFFQDRSQNYQPIAEAYVLVPALHGIGQIPIDKNPGGVTL